MHVYKLVVAYDGTAYHGWQIQPDVPSVVGTLERCFHNVFKIPITITGASRTDAGVHALGQVAHFALGIHIPAHKMAFAWNNALPRDILIRSLEDATSNFHPQRNVAEKTYYYHFFQKRPVPFIARYGFFCGSVDMAKLENGLSIFVGTHDFRSFCTGYESESTVRTIHSIELAAYRRFGVYRVIIKGPGFLRYMIRRLVGAALHVAGSARSLDELTYALESKNPHQHLHVASPRGLMLHSILYKN